MPLLTALAPTRLALYLDLIRWNRPAGWLLLLWPTLSALWIAAGGFPGWHLVAVFTLGIVGDGAPKHHRPCRPVRSNLGLNPEACRSVLVKAP